MKSDCEIDKKPTFFMNDYTNDIDSISSMHK